MPSSRVGHPAPAARSCSQQEGETFDVYVERLLLLRSLSPLLRLAIWLGRKSRRLAVIVLGFAVLGSGLAMLVLPGPGLIVVLLGLALLATEFAWAEVALSRTAQIGRAHV